MTAAVSGPDRELVLTRQLAVRRRSDNRRQFRHIHALWFTPGQSLRLRKSGNFG
jgi:hypothetical protein